MKAKLNFEKVTAPDGVHDFISTNGSGRTSNLPALALVAMSIATAMVGIALVIMEVLE